MSERRSIPRERLRVLHFHVNGEAPVRRISELMFVQGRPVAVLRWTGEGCERHPDAIVPLDTARLRPTRRGRNLFRYNGVTAEPVQKLWW
jgi:hypothetical protein